MRGHPTAGNAGKKCDTFSRQSPTLRGMKGRTILRAPLALLNAAALRAPPSRLTTSGARRLIPVVSPALPF